MNYLLFVTHSYAYPILRPLQQAIRQRGGQAAWYIEPTSPDLLNDDELRLHNLRQVREWNPVAVFAPGNWVYHFFPGIKVSLFHGYPINKRADRHDDHFRLRGHFDIYCTSGPTSTQPFMELEALHHNFKVYETGWAKADDIVKAANDAPDPLPWDGKRTPRIFVATTFSRRITQLSRLLPVIRHLVETRCWQFLLTRHPKLTDPTLLQQLQQLADDHPDLVRYYPVTPPPSVMAQTDAMLCDTSSIILEYMMLDRPVVTLCNTTPGSHLVNVTTPSDVEQALMQALQRPQTLMQAMHQYLDQFEHHRDGNNCHRILEAVDDFAANWQGKLVPRKPNLWRRLQLWKNYYSSYLKMSGHKQ